MAYAKDSIRTLIVRIFLMFFQLLGGIINARWLGAEGIGILVILLLIPRFCFRFGNLGLGSSFSYFVAKKRAMPQDMLKLALKTGIPMSALCALILLAVWKYEVSPWHDTRSTLFYFALLGIPLMFLRNFIQRIISGELRIVIINISETLNIISYIFFLIFLVVILKLGIWGALCASIASEVLSLFYMLFNIRKVSGVPVLEEEKARSNLKFSTFWSFGGWNYLNMLTLFCLRDFLPIIFLKYFFPNSVVGLFSVARGLVNRIQILPDTFANLLFPFTAACEKREGVRRTNILCRNFMIIIGLSALTLGFTAKYLITLLYGPSFLNAVNVFYALLPAILTFPLFRFLSTHIAASGIPKMVFFVRIVVVPVCLGLCFFVIPFYGAIGAAVIMSTNYTLLFVICLPIYMRFTKSKLTEMLMPQKADWFYYKNFFKIAASGFTVGAPNML